MKLWLQSGSGLSTDGATAYGRRYETSLQKRLEAIARPGTTFDVRGIGSTPYGKDRYHSAKHKVATGVIESALRAEAEGYDAVAVINTFDHGYYELRELLRIPVAFISESTLHLACQLAPTVAVIGHNTQIRLQVEELGKRYGLASRMVDGESMDLTYEDFPRMYDDPAAYLERFRGAARAAIARGAGAFLVAGNPLNMFLVDHNALDVDGAPVIDGCAVVFKTAEAMVDLAHAGIGRSRTGLFSVPDHEALVMLQGEFG